MSVGATLLAFLIVLFSMSILGRVVQWRIRVAARRLIPDNEIIRSALHVPVRAFVSGTPSFKGISSRHLNRFKLDLVLSEKRFLAVSNRGVLLELDETNGSKFRSVRCTGPQRLIIEGDLPGISRPGEYRFELVLTDAQEWSSALQPWVVASDDGNRFGQLPDVQ